MIIPVILAGGTGTRLWPLSRAALPKQFIHFPEQNSSLFQNTLARLAGLPQVHDPVVVCNTEQRFLVAEQLRQLGMDQARILLEPVGRNTAPAVAIAALSVLTGLGDDEDADLLVLPADHNIKDVAAFQQAVLAGLESSAQGRLVTFGIVPGSPETGYGYIKGGEAESVSAPRDVLEFVEKPDAETARAYLDSGNYFWNSGMFLFSARTFLHELEAHAADIASACHKTFASLDAGSDFHTLPETEFAACRSDSIDYAVMEHTSKAVMVPLNAGWSDLGAWDAIWESEEKDAAGNALSGDVVTENVQGSYIHSGSRLVTALGLKNMVVVETPDAVLVANKSRSQDVKLLVEKLQDRHRGETLTHTLVHRPWGSFQSLASGSGYQVKHIVVAPGAALSLQMHHHRAEHWTVIRGTGLVTLDAEQHELTVNDSIFIPLGSKHRLANNTDTQLEIIEVQVGDYLGEDDIVRFDDLYGRTSKGS